MKLQLDRQSRERSAPDPAQDGNDTEELGSGMGAASALERMKAERALRHERQHGARKRGSGHDEDAGQTK